MTANHECALTAAIEEFAAVDPSELSDEELHDRVVQSERLDSVLSAVRARDLAAWDARKAWADDGSKSAASRLARDCQVSKCRARRELRRARMLRQMPHTATALLDGKLTIDQVDVLVHVNQRDVSVLFERDEALLVDQMRTMPFSDSARVAKFWLYHAHDEMDVDPWCRVHEGRHFSAVRTLYDTVSLDGMLDPMAGTVLLNELSRLEQQLFERDWAAAHDEHGDHAKGDDLLRTATQRRADALVEMARRSAVMPEASHISRPLITVLAGYDAFANVCELADGTVVAPGQVVPYLREADIERVVFDGPSRVIDVGVRRRFFAGGLRRAIEVRDRHCQHPSGCDVPAEQCHIDHKVPYGEGGLTTQVNGRCYCPVHNRRRTSEPGRRRPLDPPVKIDDG